MSSKDAVKLLPWPVVLIGAYHNGKHNAMTASWVSQVSFDPLLMMVSIAPERHTYDLIRESGEFVISVLTQDQAEVARFCGSRSGRDTDKIAALALKTIPGKKVKVPLIEDCLANIECRVTAAHPAGDHVIFIGEVVEGTVTQPGALPLLMLNWEPGAFAGIKDK